MELITDPIESEPPEAQDSACPLLREPGMVVELLIDGYNLLHNAGLARPRYGPGEFEQARNKLLRRLRASLTEDERAHTTIVFDAQYAERPDRRPMNLYGMTVLFSPRGRQADDLMEILLAGHPNPRQVRVVSSDLRLQLAARSARAACIDSDSFLVELDERRFPDVTSGDDASQNAPDKPASTDLPSVDVQHWMQEFGEIDVNAIQQDVQQEELKRRRELSPPPTVRPSPASPDASPAPIADGPKDADQQCRQGKNTSTAEDSPTETSVPSESELSFWEQRIEEMLRDEER